MYRTRPRPGTNNTNPEYRYGRLFGAGRAVHLAVHIRVLQILPRQSARRRAGRVPLRQRHQTRATARGVRRVRRVRKRPTAVCLTPPSTCRNMMRHRQIARCIASFIYTVTAL